MEFRLILEAEGEQSVGNVELENLSLEDVLQMPDDKLFLISEAFRTALLHDNGILHDMTKELHSKLKK